MGKMRRGGRRYLLTGIVITILFVVWTLLIQVTDVQPSGVKGTDIGFVQLIKRRSLVKVDLDLSVLGIYYVIVIVIVCYLIFESN